MEVGLQSIIPEANRERVTLLKVSATQASGVHFSN